MRKLNSSVDRPDSSVSCVAIDPLTRSASMGPPWGPDEVTANTLPRCCAAPTRSSSPKCATLRIMDRLTEPGAGVRRSQEVYLRTQDTPEQTRPEIVGRALGGLRPRVVP